MYARISTLPPCSLVQEMGRGRGREGAETGNDDEFKNSLTAAMGTTVLADSILDPANTFQDSRIPSLSSTS